MNFREMVEANGGLVPIKDFLLMSEAGESTIRRQIRSGELSAVKVHGRWFVRISGFGREVLELLKQGEEV